MSGLMEYLVAVDATDELIEKSLASARVTIGALEDARRLADACVLAHPDWTEDLLTETLRVSYLELRVEDLRCVARAAISGP